MPCSGVLKEWDLNQQYANLPVHDTRSTQPDESTAQASEKGLAECRGCGRKAGPPVIV